MNQKGFIKDIVILVLAALVVGYLFVVYQQKTFNIELHKLCCVDETFGWKTYRNEKYGFEFKHPNTYQVEELVLDFPVVRYSHIYEDIGKRSGSGIGIARVFNGVTNIYIYSNKAPYKTYEEYILELKNIAKELTTLNNSSAFNEIEFDRKKGLISESEATRKLNDLNKKIEDYTKNLTDSIFYQFSIKNGNVVLDNSDSYGFPGAIHNMYAWGKNNEMITFYSGEYRDEDELKNIYQSFKFTK